MANLHAECPEILLCIWAALTENEIYLDTQVSNYTSNHCIHLHFNRLTVYVHIHMRYFQNIDFVIVDMTSAFSVMFLMFETIHIILSLKKTQIHKNF